MLLPKKVKRLKKQVKFCELEVENLEIILGEERQEKHQLRRETKTWRKAALLGVVLYLGNWLFDPRRG